MEKLNDYFQIRKFELNESFRLIKEDSSKHFNKVIGLWLMPLIIRGSGVAKDAYFFMRHVDDVIDGDLELEREPLDYVKEIGSDISEGFNNPNYPVESLAFRSLEILEKRKKREDNPKQFFLDGIDVAIRDFGRAKGREALVKVNDMENYYINSFAPHFNIMLTAIGSDLRGNDVGTFSYCQGFAYGVQDFNIDWQRGLINVPGEVLDLAGLTTDHPLREVKSNLIIKDWIISESARNRVDLASFLEKINDFSEERPAKFLFNSLSKRVTNILEGSIF